MSYLLLQPHERSAVSDRRRYINQALVAQLKLDPAVLTASWMSTADPQLPAPTRNSPASTITIFAATSERCLGVRSFARESESQIIPGRTIAGNVRSIQEKGDRGRTEEGAEESADESDKRREDWN